LAEGRPIRQGDVYWVDDFPPLHGDTAKRRPVVVVSSAEMLRRDELVLVVACTSSALPSDSEAIELPNTSRTPQKERLEPLDVGEPFVVARGSSEAPRRLCGFHSR
jgi:hypothetical protein